MKPSEEEQTGLGHHVVLPKIHWLLFGLALGTGVACEREKRELQPLASSSQPSPAVQTTSLNAGGALPSPPKPLKYEENAYAMNQGQQLYSDFNCSTCHANGGGDIGPPLLDNKWIYGGSPEQIYASIIQGRPNGMPSFRDRIADFQVWQLVAYVRSLSGLASPTAAPGRDDHMQTTLPPNTTEQEKPIQSFPPQ